MRSPCREGESAGCAAVPGSRCVAENSEKGTREVGGRGQSTGRKKVWEGRERGRMGGLLGVTSRHDHRPTAGGPNRSSSSEYRATYACRWA